MSLNEKYISHNNAPYTSKSRLGYMYPRIDWVSMLMGVFPSLQVIQIGLDYFEYLMYKKFANICTQSGFMFEG